MITKRNGIEVELQTTFFVGSYYYSGNCYARFCFFGRRSYCGRPAAAIFLRIGIQIQLIKMNRTRVEQFFSV